MRFLDVIEKGDWDAVKKVILSRHKEDRDFLYRGDSPPFYRILWSQAPGAEEMALYWLDHGLEYKNNDPYDTDRAAHLAAMGGKPRVLQRLMQLGDDLNQLNGEGLTPLWYAVNSGQTACVRFLLENGADPDLGSPLSVAHTPDIAAILLLGGADMNCCVSCDAVCGTAYHKFTKATEPVHPLSRACLDCMEETALFLLEQGVDPDWGDSQPLRFLAMSHAPSPVILRGLLLAGATVSADALSIAAEMGHAKLCRALLEAGTKPDGECLEKAVISGKLPCVQVFIGRGIGDRAKAIRVAARRNDRAILDYLCGQSPENTGFALHGAIEGCQWGLLKKLLEKGVDPDFPDESRRTPLIQLFAQERGRAVKRHMRQMQKYKDYRLHDAYSDNSPSIVPFRERKEILQDLQKKVAEIAGNLLALPVDARAVDSKGRSALWHAARNGWDVDPLLTAGLDPAQRDKEGVSAFEAACFGSRYDILSKFLGTGYDINLQDENGDSALLKTAKRGNLLITGSVIGFLIKNGADLDLKNKAGESFRTLAAKALKLAELLETICKK